MVPVSPKTRILRTAAISILLLAGGFLIGRLAAGPAPEEAPPVPPAPGAGAAASAPAAPAPAAEVEPLLPPDPGLAPAGRGTLAGAATTEDGEPIPGVTVRAVPVRWDWNPEPVTGVPPGDPRLAEAREELRQLTRKVHGTREAVSGPDGTFTIAGLGEGRYRVRGWKRGWILRDPGSSRVRAGDRVRLVGRPEVLVEVRVLAPDGGSVERARLISHAARYSEANQTWTPDHPLVALSPGLATLQATAGEGEPLASEEVEVRVDPKAPPAPVVLRLRERTGFLGTVRFPPVDRFANLPFEIAWLRIREGADVDPSRLARDRHGSTELRHYSPRGGTGSFSVTDVPPGRYLVGIVERNRNRDVVASAEVNVDDGMGKVELDVAPPEAGDATRVRVLDPDGRPVERNDVHLQSQVRGADGVVRGSGGAVYLGDGAWRVSRPAPAAEPGGRYQLWIRSGTWGDRTVGYDPEAPELVVSMESPVSLAVVIPDYVGSRLEGECRITVRPAGERRGFPAEKRPGPRGRTVFGPLAPGDYVVDLDADTSRWGRETVLEKTVTLAGEGAEIVLAPPPLHSLTVLGATPGAGARLEPVDRRDWRHGTADADGKLSFPRLLAGDYVLWEGAAGMPVRVDGDAVVRFVPATLDSLRVSIRDPDGALARAGLRDGDRILAVGDEPITAGDSGRFLLAAATGPTALTVLRAGREVMVTADPADFRDPSRAGGALVPWPRK